MYGFETGFYTPEVYPCKFKILQKILPLNETTGKGYIQCKKLATYHSRRNDMWLENIN
jgi:hypothetical protein